MFDVNIAAPRKIHKELADYLAPQVEQIESAIRECAQADNVYVRDIHWVALTGRSRKTVTDEEMAERLSEVDSYHVQHAWKKALTRKDKDPEGAITAARALMEAVCKHILDNSGTSYSPSIKLPNLYHLTAEQLSLAPSQKTEKIFRQIFGNCQAVVNALGSIRNELGDAHGKAGSDAAPTPLHAELAVNLAGSIATFLMSTWEKSQKASSDLNVDKSSK